jgi:HicB family
MTALTVRLPNSVHQKVRELAVRDDISVNQFIASAVSEKMASVLTLDFLKLEAAKGQRSDFENYLRLVPDKLPEAGDELVSMAATNAIKNIAT